MPKSTKFLDICKTCKAYCCRIGAPKVSKEEKRNILGAGFKDYFIEVCKGVHAIKMRSRGCPYLKKDYSCKIQEVKPTVCAVWPIIPGYKARKRFYLVAKCPLCAHLVKRQLKEAKNEASKIPIKIIRESWKLSPSVKQKAEKFKYEEFLVTLRNDF